MSEKLLIWHDVGTRSDFGDDGVFGVRIGGIPIAVYELGDQVFATHDICTHGLARLSEGWLEDGLIECPLHQGLFDVKTGKAAGAPCVKDVEVFPVRLEDKNRIFVGIAEGGKDE